MFNKHFHFFFLISVAKPYGKGTRMQIFLFKENSTLLSAARDANISDTSLREADKIKDPVQMRKVSKYAKWGQEPPMFVHAKTPPLVPRDRG